MAIGLTINQDAFEKFRENINKYANDVIDKEDIPTIKVDTEVSKEMVSLEKLKELEILEPYGEANPVPIFVYKNIKVEGIRLLSNNKHLKLILKDGSMLYDAIAFNMGDKEYSFKMGDKID